MKEYNHYASFPVEEAIKYFEKWTEKKFGFPEERREFVFLALQGRTMFLWSNEDFCLGKKLTTNNFKLLLVKEKLNR